MNDAHKYIFPSYSNGNFNKKGQNGSYGTLSQQYKGGKNETGAPSAIIYQRESRICPKKGNNFYFKGVS